MEQTEIAQKLEGLQTVSSISKTLNINKRTAINYAWQLRKTGHLTTEYGKRRVRLYRISHLKRKKAGYSLYEMINNNSKVKLAVREDYVIHSEKKPSVEETLARAVATKELRITLASLGLFNKIKNWSRLRSFAEKYGVGKKVGALYDVAKTVIRVKRMDNRTRKSLLKCKEEKYIIENVRSKDFKEIEGLWGIFIPFNRHDLMVYKE